MELFIASWCLVSIITFGVYRSTQKEEIDTLKQRVKNLEYTLQNLVLECSLSNKNNDTQFDVICDMIQEMRKKYKIYEQGIVDLIEAHDELEKKCDS